MKKFTEEQFDKFVRDSLYNYEQDPPMEVFESLKKKMLPKQSFWKFKIIGSAFILATSLVLIYNYVDFNNKTETKQSEHIIVQKENNELNLLNEETIVSKDFDNSLLTSNQTSNKPIINKEIITETVHNKNILINTVNKMEQYSNNNFIPTLKEQLIYNITTKSSTCKQWNGKVVINCNMPEVMFYWKELNITKNTVENLKYGAYTVYAKKADEIIDTLIINVPDSGSVRADFKIFETVLGNELIIFTENNTVVDKKSWKDNKNILFYWNFGDGTTYSQPEPSHSYSKSGSYLITLFVKSPQGCTDTVTKSYVVEIPQNFVELPNIFSPNSDGINDIFSPVLYDMQSVECTIFDRNGILIYEWNDINGYWDGKIRNTNQLASPGTYYYILKGITKSGKQILHKGMVQLVL